MFTAALRAVHLCFAKAKASVFLFASSLPASVLIDEYLSLRTDVLVSRYSVYQCALDCDVCISGKNALL